jgi:transposase
MSKYRTFTAEFKVQVVLSVLTGDRTVTEVCRQHQLSDTLFYRWKAEFLAGAPRIFEPDPGLAVAETRIAELERLVGRLTLELEVSKKALTALPSLPSKNGTSR